MFFSDGTDAASGENAFLSNFGNTPRDTDTESSIPEPDSREGATDAETSFSDEADDGQDLSDEELFAARLADSLADEGVELEGDGDDEEESVDEADDFENLTPEQLKELAREALALKAKDAETTQETATETVRQAIATAQQAAVAEVERAFEAEVLQNSAQHYGAELTSRLNAIIRNSRNADNPDQYILENSIAVTQLVFDARRQYEAKKAQDWNAIVQQAREDAVWSVPELREHYAQDLISRLSLPPEALADINDPRRDIRHFEQRAQELVGIATTLGTKTKQNTDQRKKDANQKLRTQKVSTSATGRQKGGKLREYTGTAEEGLPILKALTQRW